jgi:hypothetical protein
LKHAERLLGLGVLAVLSCTERALERLDCSKVTFASHGPTEVCATTDTCNIQGVLADGRALRETCTLAGCTLFVEGVQACTCSRLDYAAVCATGLPTCTEWTVDYSRVVSCPDP